MARPLDCLIGAGLCNSPYDEVRGLLREARRWMQYSGADSNRWKEYQELMKRIDKELGD